MRLKWKVEGEEENRNYDWKLCEERFGGSGMGVENESE